MAVKITLYPTALQSLDLYMHVIRRLAVHNWLFLICSVNEHRTIGDTFMSTILPFWHIQKLQTEYNRFCFEGGLWITTGTVQY